MVVLEGLGLDGIIVDLYSGGRNREEVVEEVRERTGGGDGGDGGGGGGGGGGRGGQGG